MKQIKVFALLLALCLALTGVAAFAEVYKDKATVKAVQQALNDAGYDCGTPDGSAGKKTKQAIKDYQEDHGLEPTGDIDDALLVSLGMAEPAAEAGTETNDETAGPELPHIAFRGIEFGSSMNDVDESAFEGVENQYGDLYKGEAGTIGNFAIRTEDIPSFGFDDWTSLIGESPTPTNKYEGYDLDNKFARFVIEGDIYVAGHSLKDNGLIDMYYMIPEGAVTDFGMMANVEDGIFYAASYVFSGVNSAAGEMVDNEAIRADLIEKLSGLYGEPTERDDLLVWQGDNDTEIVLYFVRPLEVLKAQGYAEQVENLFGNEPDAEKYGIMTLSYIWHGLDAQIEEVFQNSVIEGRTPEEVEGNNGGL